MFTYETGFLVLQSTKKKIPCIRLTEITEMYYIYLYDLNLSL